MLLTLAYCDRDIDQAYRWMQWVALLAKKTEFDLIPLVLVSNRWAEHLQIQAEIIRLAETVFPSVQRHIPTEDCEKPWPTGPNRMFKSTLEHLAGQDVLWIEPDAIPTHPDWIEWFRREWEQAQFHELEFMGSLSRYGEPHMTGIGVYGRNWRKYAPELATVPDHEPFDHYSGKSVLNSGWMTGLIQHRGREPAIQTLNQLETGTAIYHPDKEGRLITLLDQDMFDGECASLYAYANKTEPILMPRRFYHAENTNRAIRAGNLRIQFESYLCIGGTWQGVFTTENEGEIVALDQLVSDPRTAVRASSQEEYEKATKKKAPISSLPPVPLPQRKEPPLLGQGAVVVQEPSSVEKVPQVPTEAMAEKIEDVLEIGPVRPTPPEVPKAPKVRGRPRKPVFGSP